MFKRVILMVIAMFIIVETSVSAYTQLDLTQEERNYIAEAGVLKAISIKGVAPIQYADKKGEIRGISKRVLEEISDMTGLTFEYRLYDSGEGVYEDTNFDIFFGIPYHYMYDGMVLSQPFLESETILYINSSLNPNQLDDKIYAAVRGRVLPEGIDEENLVYFETREESLDAVEKGKADYGYGNIYSVIFYISQKGYKNIVTIPKKKESRDYCMGVSKDNDVLLSIINKSIDVIIDEGKMGTIILDETTHIDKKISFSMIMDVYDKQIFSVALLVISILLLNVILNIRLNKELRAKNKRNELLSQASNEYVYEYFIKPNRLELSKKFARLFGTQKQAREASSMLKNILLKNNLDGNISAIKLPLASGKVHTFKSIGLNIYDEKGRLDFIIGKMIDISEETEEKEKLITKSKTDGLTGLYNAMTTRELINEAIKNKDKRGIDTLIIVDCDNLKHINDTYGHLTGDQVLKNISTGLRLTFRQDDIIGRVGGDEFCVYMKNIPSVDLIKSKCHQLNVLIREINEDFYVSVSSGMAVLEDEKTYEELFEKADKFLYENKKKSGVQSVKYFNF